MDDTSVTTSVTSTINDDSSRSVASTVTTTSSSNNQMITVNEDFELWKTDEKTRYLLPHLLCKGRVEEKIEFEKHCSDAAVWNIVHVTSDEAFPERSPPLALKVNALSWLVHFKKYLNKVISAEVRMKYCNIANQDVWDKLRPDGESFSSFEDLAKRTKYSVGQKV